MVERKRSGRPEVVGILGAGAVAEALAGAFVRAGVPVRLWARRRARSQALARRVEGVQILPPSRLADLETCGCCVLCVSDRAIGEVAERLAAAVPRGRATRVALHTSGFHDEAVLRPLAERRWSTGTLHPLVSLPPGLGRRAHSGFGGEWFAIGGAAKARTAAAALVRAIGGRELRLRRGEGVRQRYHATATLVAGGLVALFDAADAALGDSATSRRAQGEAFRSLAASVLRNLSEVRAEQALTGPAARGDWDVVAGHVDALRRVDPDGDVDRLYRALTRRMVRIAERRGSVSAEARRAIESLLE